MRAIVFLVGIAMVVLGPLLTLFGLSSCLGTILSGHFLACVRDLTYIIFGGLLFVGGIITAMVGVLIPDSPSSSSTHVAPMVSTQLAEIPCKKCGHAYNSTLFFCPFCGQRPG